MAEKRMFAKTIVDSDAFLDMPPSSRLLYYDLGMRADDEGFINNPKKIMRMTGAREDDMNILILRKFIIPFESGVVVIKHWRIHNYIRQDRVHKTSYQDERNLLDVDENKAYVLMSEVCQPNGSQLTDKCQARLDKIRLDKIRLDEYSDDIHDCDEIIKEQNHKDKKHKYGEYNHVLLTDIEKSKLIDEFGESFTDECIKTLDESIEMKGYKYKSHYLAIRKWVVDAVKSKGIMPIRMERSEDYEPVIRKEDDISF
jgi:hypothetical protein|uniref:Replisome organizer n=1 Tax=Siphoviridae sp. ctGuJ10 TaxID=2825418 RepID=A0A8S5PUE0_9CAUD|nr:MAG TPA: replisome organizer [Siphoviridae sp. ctGuJ10]